MDLDKLHSAAQRPDLYEKGDSVMWTDEHISRKLLELHLDPKVDSASRSQESIDRTIEFILSHCADPPMSILDLGCGPGIYLERLAGRGHHCTGIDFSGNSISYARKQAKAMGLEIQYIQQDYLELDFEEAYDLILLIYTDFGVLLPEERDALLKGIRRALKPGGFFIFDVLNSRNLKKKFCEFQTWSYEFGGFWMPHPYLELASGYHYPEHRVFLKQHTILDDSEQIRNYRFWTHYFTPDQIKDMLHSRGFEQVEHFERVLPANDIWDGENVTFYKTKK
jgi:SAM-dependent methyltransferase